MLGLSALLVFEPYNTRRTVLRSSFSAYELRLTDVVVLQRTILALEGGSLVKRRRQPSITVRVRIGIVTVVVPLRALR